MANKNIFDFEGNNFDRIIEEIESFVKKKEEYVIESIKEFYKFRMEPYILWSDKEERHKILDLFDKYSANPKIRVIMIREIAKTNIKIAAMEAENATNT